MKGVIWMYQLILMNWRISSQAKMVTKTLNKTNPMTNQARIVKHRLPKITIIWINMLLMICINNKQIQIKCKMTKNKKKAKIIKTKSQKKIKNLMLVKKIRISIRKIKMKMIN